MFYASWKCGIFGPGFVCQISTNLASFSNDIGAVRVDYIGVLLCPCNQGYIEFYSNGVHVRVSGGGCQRFASRTWRSTESSISFPELNVTSDPFIEGKLILNSVTQRKEKSLGGVMNFACDSSIKGWSTLNLVMGKSELNLMMGLILNSVMGKPVFNSVMGKPVLNSVIWKTGT